LLKLGKEQIKIMTTRRNFLIAGAGTAAALATAWNPASLAGSVLSPFSKGISLARMASFHVVRETATEIEAKVRLGDFIKFLESGDKITSQGQVLANGNELRYHESGKAIHLHLA
jgi:archaeosine-15-forming tRNA-guanine transglycosylase